MVWCISAFGALCVALCGAHYVKSERLRLMCHESVESLRDHHNQLMRQTRSELEKRYSSKVNSLTLQLQNRDEVVDELGAKLDALRQANKELTAKYDNLVAGVSMVSELLED